MGKKKHKVICDDCGYLGRSVKGYSGSCLIEIILWCAFIIPGLIYSFYRVFSQKQVCGDCGSDEIFGINSREGREIYENYKVI